MPLVMWSATTVPRIEPMTATPIVPPRLRKNVTRARGDAQVLHLGGVLHDEHEVLHDHADARAEHEHRDADVAEVGVVVERD